MGRVNIQELGTDAMEKVGGIVLGGGRGTRLYPLTKVRSKPAVPLCGRYRLVDIPLSNCIHSGINEIFVLTQFNSHSLNRHINNTYRFDDFQSRHVSVLAAEQTEETGDWFQGTSDAVRKQLSHLWDADVEHFVILSGDQLYRMDYRTMMRTHLRSEADITVAALPVSRNDARDFGIMQVSAHGKIKRFVEKPTEKALLDQLVTPKALFEQVGLKPAGKPYLASMGVYAFKAEVLRKLLLENPEWIDFGRELIPGALKSHKVMAHMFAGFWEDIGTVRSYFDVSMAMTSANPPFQFHDPKHQIFTHSRALPGVVVQNAVIKRAIICPGSKIIKAEISEAIIGIRSRIRAGAAIKRCVMLGADYYETDGTRAGSIPMGIGKNAKITNAIIDHNARIGPGVVIKGSKKLKNYDGDGYSIRDGIVVVHKNAKIPKGMVIA